MFRSLFSDNTGLLKKLFHIVFLGLITNSSETSAKLGKENTSLTGEDHWHAKAKYQGHSASPYLLRVYLKWGEQHMSVCTTSHAFLVAVEARRGCLIPDTEDDCEWLNPGPATLREKRAILLSIHQLIQLTDKDKRTKKIKGK